MLRTGKFWGRFYVVLNPRIALNDDNLLTNLGTNIFFKEKKNNPDPSS